MKRNPLFVDVAEDMLNMIHSDYPPGSKIPTEPQLSDIFGVSRTTIRASVQSLVSRNVLEIRRGDGTYVKENPGFSTDAFGLDFLNSNSISADIGEISFLLQPAAAALAAQRATDRDLKKLSSCISKLEKAWDSYKTEEISYHDIRVIDSEFHRAVMTASHNQLIARVTEVMEEFSRKKREKRNIKIIEDSLRLHRQIYSSICTKDADKARTLMQKHMENVNEYLTPDSLQ